MDSTCSICGKSFVKAAGVQFDVCPACMQATKQRYDAPKNGSGAAQQIRKAAPYMAWITIVVGISITAVRWPEMSRAIAKINPPPPAELDAKDLCVSNLWAASALIQQNRWPSDALRCPATKSPYATQEADGDLTVACPNPGSHGLRALRVSRKHPTPELAAKP
jgi:hypothetical protein